MMWIKIYELGMPTKIISYYEVDNREEAIKKTSTMNNSFGWTMMQYWYDVVDKPDNEWLWKQMENIDKDIDLLIKKRDEYQDLLEVYDVD
jgi:hypothetical protein